MILALLGLALPLAFTAPVAAQDTPEELFKQAQKFERDGKVNRAIEYYQRMVDEHPTHSQILDARYGLAKNQDSIGQIDAAITNLMTVVKSRGKGFKHRQDALYLLGKLYGAVEQYDPAVQVFEQLLKEGAGLYEDEALNLCGGYYAVLEKYDEASVKFNLLKRRPNSQYAERAAYKLAMVWIKAGNLELAVDAVNDLAERFPNNVDVRGLMIELADAFRRGRRFDQAVGVCEQLRRRYPATQEGRAAAYILALCYRDRKENDKAIATLVEVGREPENQKTGLASEALALAGDIYYAATDQREKAMDMYEEASIQARQGRGDRQSKILEHCYFRLAEHYFAQKKWALALEYYTLLRGIGTKINILPRIIRCQTELEMDLNVSVQSEKEIELIKQKIADNPGTFAAAEGEVFLIDMRLDPERGASQAYEKLIADYRSVLTRYSKAVLSEFHLESYIYAKIGQCYTAIAMRQREYDVEYARWDEAFPILDHGLNVDPDSPYREELLTSLARIADVIGNQEKAFEVYKQLFELSEAKVKEGGGAAEQEEMTDHLRSMLTRAEKKDSIAEAIAVAQRIVEQRGVESTAARHAMLYMGELYYLSKDFSAAAKAYKNVIATYGPKQDANGDIAGGPWKPANVTEAVEQVYEAALRVAHCWYMQGHGQNMIRAYAWMVKNFPNNNDHVAEAQYWLAMELSKGPKAESEDQRRKLAETLWTTVVHPSLDFGAPNFAGGFYPWVRNPDASKYPKAAIMKAGELYGGLGEHERAAEIFASYLRLFPQPTVLPGREPPAPDAQVNIARYALGRERLLANDVPGMIEAYKPYLNGLRDDGFRASALQVMGHHATQEELWAAAIDAYATILDEYGKNKLNPEGKPIAVPRKQWIREGSTGWNGIRMKPPEKLDLGTVRFALGLMYWRKEDWSNCVKVLEPFVQHGELASNESRAKALYMIGKSQYKLLDYAGGVKTLSKMIVAYPSDPAIEEVYVYTARGQAALKQWTEIDALYKTFVKAHPDSLNRDHMDLYHGLSTLRQGKMYDGMLELARLVESDTYEDVKADALYYLGVHTMEWKQEYKDALEYLEKSVDMYAREQSCLAAAKCCVELQQWDRAKVYLDRTLREFPGGERQVIADARELLPMVQRKIVEDGR